MFFEFSPPLSSSSSFYFQSTRQRNKKKKKKINKQTNARTLNCLTNRFVAKYRKHFVIQHLPELCADEFDVITLFVLLHRENCCRLSVGLDGSIFISISTVPFAKWECKKNIKLDLSYFEKRKKNRNRSIQFPNIYMLFFFDILLKMYILFLVLIQCSYGISPLSVNFKLTNVCASI